MNIKRGSCMFDVVTCDFVKLLEDFATGSIKAKKTLEDILFFRLGYGSFTHDDDLELAQQVSRRLACAIETANINKAYKNILNMRLAWSNETLNRVINGLN